MPCFEATQMHFAFDVLISDVDQEFIIAMYILKVYARVFAFDDLMLPILITADRLCIHDIQFYQCGYISHNCQLLHLHHWLYLTG
jgi:hypothetical protein